MPTKRLWARCPKVQIAADATCADYLLKTSTASTAPTGSIRTPSHFQDGSSPARARFVAKLTDDGWPVTIVRNCSAKTAIGHWNSPD